MGVKFGMEEGMPNFTPIGAAKNVEFLSVRHAFEGVGVQKQF